MSRFGLLGGRRFDLIGDVGRHRLVVGELGREGAAALGDRAQVGGVALDLGRRDDRLDRRRAVAPGFMPLTWARLVFRSLITSPV